MGKKRVGESEGMKEMFTTTGNETAGMVLDINPSEMPMPKVYNPMPSVQEEEPVRKAAPVKQEKELINCLRNERVVVRFVPSIVGPSRRRC